MNDIETFACALIELGEAILRQTKKPPKRDEKITFDNRGLSRRELDLFLRSTPQSSMTVHMDERLASLTNRELVNQIMEGISEGKPIARHLLAYELILNKGQGGALKEEDEVTDRDLGMLIGKQLHLEEFFPKLKDCCCFKDVEAPICLWMIQGIIDEVLSPMNIYGTEVSGVSNPLLKQAIAHYVRDKEGAQVRYVKNAATKGFFIFAA